APDSAYAATMMDPGMASGYAPSAGGGARLVALDGPYAGQFFPLTGEISIGRDPSQSIPLGGDGTASRHHPPLSPTNGSWVLTDSGSSNGTWINGVRIQTQPLFPGDTIRIGGTQFRFEA